jgi:hypothetical protein
VGIFACHAHHPRPGLRIRRKSLPVDNQAFTVAVEVGQAGGERIGTALALEKGGKGSKKANRLTLAMGEVVRCGPVAFSFR